MVLADRSRYEYDPPEMLSETTIGAAVTSRVDAGITVQNNLYRKYDPGGVPIGIKR